MGDQAAQNDIQILNPPPAFIPPPHVLQQQRLLMDSVVREIQQMFPDVEEQFVRDRYVWGVNVLADFIIEHPAAVPRKAKRRLPPTEPKTPDTPQALEVDGTEVEKRRRIRRLGAERATIMTVFDRAEFRFDSLTDYRMCRETVVNLIANKFPKIHLTALRRIVDSWKSNYAPAYAVVWCKTLDIDWTLPDIPYDGIGNNTFGGYQVGRYDSFLLNKKLRPARPLRTEIPPGVQRQVDLIAAMEAELKANDGASCTSSQASATFECAICCEEQPLQRALTCTGNNEHSFCLDCVRGHASAAAESASTAGTGLQCMERDCNAVLPWSAVRRFVPSKLRSRLSERFMVENVNCAGLDLERCKYCNYAVEMEASKEQNKVFKCAKCDSEICRLCGRDWDEKHIGRKCEEVAERDGDIARREYEDKLSEAVIRRCPRCHTPFDKQEGCNKMTCRCGMTQCYLCRQAMIDYTHYCPHVRDPTRPDHKCEECDKSCLLWENPAARDARVLAEIEAKAKEDNRLVDQIKKHGPIGGIAPRVIAAPPVPPAPRPQLQPQPLARPHLHGPRRN